jgi:HK97 family phage major capsid protein
MVNTTTTGSKVAVIGDWDYFMIGDHLGMTIEIVPHLFGASRRPTGERGFFAYWRTGSVVLAPNAFRYLEVQ